MISRLRLIFCFFVMVVFYCRIGYTEDYKHLTVKEIGDSVLFDCSQSESCGINEKNTINNLKSACVEKNKIIQNNNADQVKKCIGDAYKGMKELYSYYY